MLRDYNKSLAIKRNNRKLGELPTIMKIGDIVSQESRVPLRKLRGKGRQVPLPMFPKHVWRVVSFMYGYEHRDIALEVGCDRTTSIASVREHQSLMFDPRYKNLFLKVLGVLNNFCTPVREPKA
jgi:hypothetical protein